MPGLRSYVPLLGLALLTVGRGRSCADPDLPVVATAAATTPLLVVFALAPLPRSNNKDWYVDVKQAGDRVDAAAQLWVLGLSACRGRHPAPHDPVLLSPAPAVSTFTVDPARLQEPALARERAAESLAGAARAVVGVIVPTGRPDTELATVHLLQALGTAVQRRAEAAREDSRLLALAQARYEAAEHLARGG